MQMKISVRAHELPTLLDRMPKSVTTLSLDCFDTLLWRNTQAPRDVFAEIALPGGGIEPRVWAEGVAQRMANSRSGSHEITLTDVYRRLLTNASEDEIAAAVSREIEIEARHLFPFKPVVELMRDAKARGLQIILVSDMYLSEAQLRELLLRTAGDEVLGMIDRIFMSNEYGMPKSQGLFVPVLKALGIPGDRVLHVGDNYHADYEGAIRAGIHAVHFEQFQEETAKRLRMEAAAGIMLDPATRVTVPAYQPHRPQLSLRTNDDIAYVVGHDVMGPVMHAMAIWLKAEVDAMAARLGKPVRPLFLMRDGYLPYMAYDALYPEDGARRIEISRLSAARASLYDEATLDEFVTEYIDVLPAKALARQLMLFEHEVAKIVKPPRPGHDPQKELKKAVAKGDVRKKILVRSKNFAQRLCAHLALNDVKPGDAVMLVDVGYKGTVQNIITPVLEREMGLTIAGRYIFLREECMSGLDKAGLLGTDMFECRALHALGTCVAVVEQMCNIAAGSTVDYAPDGEAIREESGLKSQQNDARDAVQAACLDYVRAHHDAMHRRPTSDDVTARRRMAGSVLTRLLFMPLESEIRLFERFDHDVNLGTKAMMKLLDHEEAAEGLRRRGISYVNETRRMYVPGELLKHGMPYNLSVLTTSRFGLDMRDQDFDVGGIDVPVILIDDMEQTIVDCTAYPTNEGYYRVAVPVGMRNPTVAVQLGRIVEWVQIDSVHWTGMSQYSRTWTAKTTEAVTIPDGMETIDEGFYKCADTGVLIVPPPSAKEPQVLSVVFRPLKWRSAGEKAKVAA